MPVPMTRAGSLALIAGLCAGLWTPAQSAETKPGDSAAAVAFTKQPLRAWWERLSEPEQKAFLAKQPVLSLSFDFHRKVLGAATPSGVVAERSLKDWWDGLAKPQRDAILAQQPAMRDAFKDWRKAVDGWTAKERAAKAKNR